jgi:hypothetical protein
MSVRDARAGEATAWHLLVEGREKIGVEVALD